ncbi:MAG: hypothetical protein WA091_00550 [Minisyncoccales bacterium]
MKMDYLELSKTRDTALSNLKTDCPELIEKAREWAKQNGYDPEKIIEIKAWVIYGDRIRGYMSYGSSLERIYLINDVTFRNFSMLNKYLGKEVEVNGNSYSLEIFCPLA